MSKKNDATGFWITLVLPLVGLFGIALLLNRYLDGNSNGFFINLATEVVGIGITVFYVDRILKRHEQAQWKGADARVGARLQILLNSIVSSIRSGLRYGADIIDELLPL
jgi:hypothetical protein